MYTKIKTRKQKNTAHYIGVVLIATGILLVFATISYKVASYPWSVVLSKFGLEERLAVDLPDPPPLPRDVNVKSFSVHADGDATESTMQDPLDQGAIIQQPDFFAARPKMDITLLGTIKVPMLDLSENILEGSGDELFYGVGHVTGTAMPGQSGNCVLAGHRNYVIMHPFRHLDKLKIGNKVTIQSDTGIYTYETVKIFTVGPDDSWILQSQPEEDHLLTLITCTPVLNPTDRLIVWCRLVEAATESA